MPHPVCLNFATISAARTLPRFNLLAMVRPLPLSLAAPYTLCTRLGHCPQPARTLPGNPKGAYTMATPTTTNAPTKAVTAPAPTKAIALASTAPAPAPAPAAPVAAGKPATHPGHYVVHVLVANPKKPGSKSHARFALYQTGQTVSAYLAACAAAGQKARAARADLTWDTDAARGFVAVLPPGTKPTPKA